MIKVFDKNKINDYQGIFSNPESYTVDIELLNEFDKAFPPKIKEKIEDQFNEDVASLAVELYKNLSEKNIPEAQNVADKYYNKFYNNIGEEHDNK